MNKIYEKTIFLAVIFFLTIATSDTNAQSWQWARTSSCHDTLGIEGWLTKTDTFNNIYVAGYNTGDSACFGSYSFYHPFLNAWYGQTLIAKYDSLGNVIWAVASTNGNSAPINMTLDKDGNLYVLGYYGRDSIMFGSQLLINPHYITTSFEPTNASYFIVKINPAGTVLWIKGGGRISVYENYTLSPGGIANDEQGNIYITGVYNDTTLTIGTHVLTNTSPSTDEIFMAKYDSSGNVIWAKSFGGSKNDEALNIAVSSDQKVYVSGIFGSPSITFGSSTLSYSSPHPSSAYGYNDIFLTELDTAGNPVWAKSSLGAGNAYCMSIDKTNNIYIGGNIKDTSFNFGGYAMHGPLLNYGALLLKCDSGGNTLWAKALTPTTTVGYFFPNIVFGLTTDIYNNVWIAGGMDSSGGMKLDTTTILHAPSGIFHIPSGETWTDPFFLVTYNSAGHLLNYLSLSSGGDDMSGLSSDSRGNIYVCADFRNDSFVLGPDILNLSNNELENFLVAKYGPNHFDNPPLFQNTNTLPSPINLFPNPTHTEITIIAQKITTVSITNIIGQTIFDNNYDADKVLINVADIPSGIYFVRVNGTEVRKLVKQ